MKGPSNIASYFSVHIHNRQNPSQKDFNGVKNSDLFTMLLEDNINNIKNPEKQNSAALPLDKNYLRQLIDVVQRQMNDYLFRELSNFDENNDLYGFNCEWMSFHGTQNLDASFVSKTKHGPQKGRDIKSQPEVNDIIENASNIYEVDPKLIRSIIKAESDFDANATSSKGAMGLMQLMPETAKDLGVKDCYNPVENIMAGTRYLKSLLDRYEGNIELTLAAYNWGMGNVERHPEKLPKETREYISKIKTYSRSVTS
jgi:SLT domain-containing protein